MLLPNIDISINSPAWPTEEKLLPLLELAISQAAITAGLEWQEGAELSVLFSDDAEIKDLNAKWRNIDKSTNVLSFPGENIQIGDAAGFMIGDIIIAHETVAREAVEQEIKFDDHLTHLIVHGFLHLFGYDHQTDEEAIQMEGLETKILAELNIADPYQN